MLGTRNSSKFETRVHLGLLIIIFVLISLNFVSNFITYNLRDTQKKLTLNQLQSAAVAISRTISDKMPSPSESQLEYYEQRYNISGLILIPSQPEDPSIEGRRQWFLNLVHQLPTSQVPEVARKILGAEYTTLTRGEIDEYFLVYPVPSGSKKYLLIVSINSPELAYLDDAGDTMLAITIFSTLLIIATYYYLVRYIFKPFRQLRKEAFESGRIVSDGENEAEAMVEDYRKVIAELKEQELNLIRRADSLEQFNNYLLQSINSGIITFDRERRILSINEAAGKLLRIEPAEYIGGKAEQLFVNSSAILNSLGKVISKRTNEPYNEIELVLNNGLRSTIGFSVSTVSDDHQQPIGASIILTDVNEISKLRGDLEAKNRLAALGEMSGGLAHQLRNSMGTIVGFCNLLKKQLSDDALGLGYFDDLFGEIKETESLVKRFLSFARPLEYHPDRTDLVRVIEEVLESQKAVASTKGITIGFIREGLEKQNFESPAVVKSDALLLKQAITNVIDNAISACKPGEGTIQVTMIRQRDSITISVTDNGQGIPEENIQKIFTPFFSTKTSGTGLGLPLAAKIMDLHGGNITVESKGDSGTTFNLVLPTGQIATPVNAQYLT